VFGFGDLFVGFAEKINPHEGFFVGEKLGQIRRRVIFFT
jgi:hypothetical protein